jgi:transcriptional regulator with XRE-family HTH domain
MDSGLQRGVAILSGVSIVSVPVSNPFAHERAPTEVDRHVGARIRLRRRLLRLSQERLAEGLRVTYQQLQKYEQGSNRVSASKLFEISAQLQVPVGYFFEGLATDEAAPASGVEARLSAFLAIPEGLDMAEVFPRIGPAARRHLLGLARALADSGTDTANDR